MVFVNRFNSAKLICLQDHLNCYAIDFLNCFLNLIIIIDFKNIVGLFM